LNRTLLRAFEAARIGSAHLPDQGAGRDPKRKSAALAVYLSKIGGTAMYRMICAVTTLLVAVAVQPATADDPFTCSSFAPVTEEVLACSRLLAKGQNDAEAYEKRGNAYYIPGDYDRAISDFDQAIRVNPNDAFAYYGAARHMRTRPMTTGRSPTMTKRSAQFEICLDAPPARRGS